MCYLVGSLPNGLVFRHELANHRSTIGRLGISTILLEEESISALHAELIPVGDRKYLLRDLRSRNGTSVDGEKVSEAEIKAPCRLEFGHLSCELQSCESETCMAHGKKYPTSDSTGLIRRPLPPSGPARPMTPQDQSSRQRKSRPLSRKRRAKHTGGIKLDLSQPAAPAAVEAGRRDTSADSFAAPRRHAGHRAMSLSPKLLAMGASLLLFCAFAIGYSGPRRAPQKTVGATAVPRVQASRSTGIAPDPIASEPAPEKGGDPSAIPAPVEPSAPLVAMAKVESVPAPVTDNSEEEFAPEAIPTATATSSTGASPVADVETEEALSLQEAKLLASVSKQESPITSIPVAPPATEPENAEAPESEGPAPVDFSMPMVAPSPRRPWEVSATPETDLALNEYSRLVAPWSFEAGVARIGGDGLASLFSRQPTVRVPVPVPAKAVVREPMSVMILGDSLALCGFGSRLDKRFRESANVRATNTYMACGTVPMSWLKEPPYSNLKTYCGFWTIENPVAANKKPASFQDTYGMGKGKPKAYPVPKLEDLFAKAAPEVLILQTGTNLFSLFRDGKTVQPEHHIPMLRSQIQPFLAKILKLPQPPRAIYWVASPTSGRVSTEVQDFVIQQITALVGPMAKIIDSRPLVSFPYRHMEPDKEHFIGQDMDQWADRVYDIVQRDLEAHPLPLALARPPGLAEKPPVIAAKSVGKPNLNDATAVRLTAKLVGKTKPMRLEELKPYRESLVSFIYEVQKVTEGEYSETKILVMQPAHIDNVAQPLDKLRIGKTYELSVHELQESSPWMTTKKKDDSGLIDLLPYIQLSDESRFPGHQSETSDSH